MLRVDRKFRTHGPEGERAEYHKRPAVEAAYAFLKAHSASRSKVRQVQHFALSGQRLSPLKSPSFVFCSCRVHTKHFPL